MGVRALALLALALLALALLALQATTCERRGWALTSKGAAKASSGCNRCRCPSLLPLGLFPLPLYHYHSLPARHMAEAEAICRAARQAWSAATEPSVDNKLATERSWAGAPPDSVYVLVLVLVGRGAT